MNREIKFRLWRDGRMQGVHTMFSKASESESPCEPQNFAFSEEEVLMQFTGLHDKNGKEIYEGDILKVITKALPKHKSSDGYTYFGSVKYEYGEFVIGFKEKFGFRNSLNIWALNHTEVIGNIHETPELLK